MSDQKQLLNLTKRLYPTGRAFRIPVDSVIEKIHKALAKSEQRAYQAATKGILDTILPDNDGFDASAATKWEQDLGLLGTNRGLSLKDRKQSILRKYAYPYGAGQSGLHPAKLEDQLHRAGFDQLYIHQNLAGDRLIDIVDYLVDPIYLPMGRYQMGQRRMGEVSSYRASLTSRQHGSGQHNTMRTGQSTSVEVVANSMVPEQDRAFVIAHARMIFIVGGKERGEFGTANASRKAELRELILKLKPLHMAAVLLVNYINE